MMNIELDFIKDMFDSIAPKYDFLNRFLSLRQDIRWRREIVVSANIPDHGKVVDIACGTCDVALEIEKQKKNKIEIFAADFSPGMLKLGKKKISDKGKKNTIHLMAANALNLPFKHNSFDAIFIAFGIRNIMDRKTALTEFHDSLKKGGKAAILELTTPEQGMVKKFYMFYFKRILPFLGTIFSKNSGAYHYLPESVIKFPSQEEFARIMRSAGFSEIKWKQMTFGIVTLFVGTKDV